VSGEIGYPVTVRHRAAILAAALGLVNACAPSLRVGPVSQDRAWRSYLGSPLRASAALESVNVNPQPVWRTDLGRGIVGGPAVTEDVIAVSQVDRQVALLNRSTGDVIWRRRLPLNIGAGPLLEDDRVFVATQTDGGRVYALRLSTGRIIWSSGAGDVVAPLVVEDTVVYSASVEGWVSAYLSRNGGRLWRVRLPGSVRAAPVVAAGGLIVGTASDSLYRLDTRSGRVESRRGLRGAVLAAPALADTQLIVGTSSGGLMALDPVTLTTRWSLELGSGLVGSVAASRGSVYALTASGVLWSVPVGSAAGARRLELRVVSRAGPAPVAGGVFLSSVAGEVALVDEQGVRRWSARLPAPVAEPVVVDGRMILAVSERGEVVAFR
jgi:outer membrane protein assembly factor BamB